MSGRTLVITNDFPPRAGGIQSFVYGLVSRRPEGSVVVFAPTWHGSERFDAAQNFPVIRYSRTLMLPSPAVSTQARKLIRDYDCDRVLFGASAPLGLLGPALRKSGIQRVVGVTHGHEVGWAATPGARSLLRRIGTAADTLTYLGDYTRSHIARVLTPAAAAAMRRLVPGVDTEEFNPRNREGVGRELRERLGLTQRRVIVCVSRLMPRKGQDTLIQALPLIQRRVPEAALLIVGGGPYRRRLDNLVAAAGLDRDVTITGSIPWETMPAHYAAGDVFAMPCRTRQHGLDVEGLGIVYLEAAATGLPVVAGDSGGAPDAVLTDKTGFVVEGRAVAAVAERVSQLLTDESLANRLGTAGRTWVETHWRWPVIAGRLTQLLDGVDPDASG